MLITLDMTFYIISGVIIGCLLCLIIAYLVLLHKYRKLLDKYHMHKRDYLRKSNQVSMIEYYYRNFKEGTNAFTVLRDIGEVIQNTSLEVESQNGEKQDING